MGHPLFAILDRHRSRYPLLQSRDIYKLVHQGVVGPGHIVTSAEAARRAIDDEVRRQKSEGRMQSETERTVEEIDPERRFVRVNLRPLLGRTDLAERLAGVLVESTDTFRGDAAVMGRRMQEALQWSLTALSAQAVELESLIRGAEPKGWPPVHHSDAYRQAYRPAYRVVRRDLLEASGLF